MSPRASSRKTTKAETPATPPENQRPAVVIVDDDCEDIAQLRGLLTIADWRHPVITFTDARRAIEYISWLANSSPRTLPCLLMADLHVAPIDGFELISWIRQQPSLASIRIVALSRENAPSEFARARTLGADACCEKFPSPEILRGLLAGQPE